MQVSQVHGVCEPVRSGGSEEPLREEDGHYRSERSRAVTHSDNMSSVFCGQLMSVDEHLAGRHAGDTGPGGWAVGMCFYV